MCSSDCPVSCLVASWNSLLYRRRLVHCCCRHSLNPHHGVDALPGSTWNTHAGKTFMLFEEHFAGHQWGKAGTNDAMQAHTTESSLTLPPRGGGLRLLSNITTWLTGASSTLTHASISLSTAADCCLFKLACIACRTWAICQLETASSGIDASLQGYKGRKGCQPV